MSDSESSDGNNSAEQRRLLELEEQRIKRELSQLPYSQILKYRQNTMEKEQQKKQKQKKKKVVLAEKIEKGQARQIKIMKRRPKMHSKPIFQSQRKKGKDPRFEEYAGNLNPDLAKKTYSFIPEMQNIEAEELRKRIKDKKIRQDEKGILMKQYGQLRDQMKKNQTRQIQQKIKAANKKNPNFHLKKRELKERFERGKLNELTDKEQRQRINKKEKQIQKRRIIDRKMAMK